MSLHQHIWSHSANREALRIVRNVICSNPKPLTTHEVYKLALKEPATSGSQSPARHERLTGQHVEHNGPMPPQANHAVRSMRFLKKAILPALEAKKEVEKVHTISTMTPEEVEQRLNALSKAQRRTAHIQTSKAIWVWRPKAPQPVPKPKAAVEVFGKDVGVGEDWGHLNRRRRRAREASVERDVQWLRELEKVKQEALAQPS
ncbi:hypothetical protein PsYK624_027830 [Phanerochaete sordida]|uniref:Uncharacterized protein n=1 Tax=Phanerochaete sordida TaxID=48140 RepID=A0A9P3G231_9APHY|nr:hypothetical protein PsYK624_027830 [Phanerochaete sordida]